MSFLRHVGKQGDRKVAVIFREVPGEPHMCLVVYTETLNQHIHDPMIKCIESDIGQNSENLADALNRSYTKDGKPILQTLHFEGQLKKVQTSQITMTPAPNVKIRLDELNKILNEMKQGEAAVKRLAEIDSSRGLQDPIDVARRMNNMNTTQSNSSTSADLLNDSSLAKQRLEQAERMQREAKGLMAEAHRLLEEAKSLDPSLVLNEQSLMENTNESVKPKAKTSKTKKAANAA